MSEERRESGNKDNFLAALTRINPERLAALRRISSGVARCPYCDAVNPPENRFCDKCGQKLYPVEEEDDKGILERLEEDEEKEHDRRT